jgi:hypothetical protein
MAMCVTNSMNGHSMTGHSKAGDRIDHQSPVLLLGGWNPAFLTIARSCAAARIPVHFVAVGGLAAPYQALSACLDGGGSLAFDEVGTPQGIQSILEIVERTGARGIIPVWDRQIQWLAENRARFEPHCQVMTASAECLQRLRSKRRQIELAREIGFQLLPTWYLSNAAEADAIAESDYPLVLRPDEPSAISPPFKVQLVRSPRGFARFFSGVQRLRAPVIAQPFLPLPNLLVHGVRATSGEILALQSFLVYRKFLGVSLSLRPVACPPDLARRCAEFAAAADVTGCFHFEFLGSTDGAGDAYYLEINTRFGGTTDKVTRLGFDEPRLTLEAFGCLPADKSPPRECLNAPVASKRAVLIHLRNAIAGRCTELDYPNHGRILDSFQSLYELFFVRDSLFSLADLRGTLCSYRLKHRAMEHAGQSSSNR